MALTAYCKKCAREVEPGEVCPYCGSKLGKNAAHAAWCVERTPVKDWMCWNALMRILLPAALVILLLEQNKPAESKAASDKVEMLTIGETVKEFPGLTRSTIRQLTAQKKIRFCRAGEGNNGKILINKASLVAYLNGETEEG